MIWLLVSPIVALTSLLCLSLCIVAGDSDRVIESLYKRARPVEPHRG